MTHVKNSGKEKGGIFMFEVKEIKITIKLKKDFL